MVRFKKEYGRRANNMQKTHDVIVVSLAERPELAGRVGKACFEQWPEIAVHDFGIQSADEFAAGLLQNPGLPGTLVALVDGTYAGSVIVHQCSMPHNLPELTPWLACLVVEPPLRNRGIGSHLVRCARDLAHNELGFGELFLWTDWSARWQADLYGRHGFRPVAIVEYFGIDAVVMRSSASSHQ